MKGELIMNLIELEKEKVSVGARVNKHLVQLLKEANIPISTVLENLLVSFFCMTDEEKVKLINNNNPDSTDINQLKHPHYVWGELQRKYGGEE
jgi:predicted ATP-dependent Lon-type protease